MTATFDASFLFRATVRTQLLPEARREFLRIVAARERIVAPVLLASEFYSGVRRLERIGTISPDETDEYIALLRRTNIEYQWDDAWLDRALEIAREIGASRIYDSIYLACAQANDATLYTCDAAFATSFRTPRPDLSLVG